MYLIQCIRFGSWKVRRLNRAMFTQHRMAFLADTKIKAIWESQNNMTTTRNWYLQLVQVILAERAWFSRSQFLTPVSEGSSPLSLLIHFRYDPNKSFAFPESYRVLFFCANECFCYLNLTRPAKFKHESRQERKAPEVKTKWIVVFFSSKKTSSSKWPILE